MMTMSTLNYQTLLKDICKKKYFKNQFCSKFNLCTTSTKEIENKFITSQICVQHINFLKVNLNNLDVMDVRL